MTITSVAIVLVYVLLQSTQVPIAGGGQKRKEGENKTHRPHEHGTDVCAVRKKVLPSITTHAHACNAASRGRHVDCDRTECAAMHAPAGGGYRTTNERTTEKTCREAPVPKQANGPGQTPSDSRKSEWLVVIHGTLGKSDVREEEEKKENKKKKRWKNSAQQTATFRSCSPSYPSTQYLYSTAQPTGIRRSALLNRCGKGSPSGRICHCVCVPLRPESIYGLVLIDPWTST